MNIILRALWYHDKKLKQVIYERAGESRDGLPIVYEQLNT